MNSKHHRFSSKYLFRIILLFLGIMTGVISVSPLIKSNFQGIFFSVDPDVMYVSNAISYTKAEQIHYIDHPGTPAIILMSKSLIPLRLYSKLFKQTNFIHWFVGHPEIIYLYLRLFQSILLVLTVTVFLNIIYRLTQSKISILIGWLLFLNFRHYLFFGVVISAEILSTLTVVIWLYIFSQHLIKPYPLLIIFLSIVSGFAVANKLTNAFLMPSSLLLSLVQTQLSTRQRVYNLILNGFSIACSFILFTWPIRSSYSELFSWILRLFTNSGIHGGGVEAVLDWQTYLGSALTLFVNEKILLVLFLVTLIVISYKLIIRTKIDLAWILISVLAFSAITGVAIFAKYPLSHYQQAHYLILSFIFLYILSRTRYFFQLAVLVALLILTPGQVQRYLLVSQTQINIATLIENDLRTRQINTRFWEWAPAKEFALLWGNFWSAGSYDEELKASEPNFFAISGDMRRFYLDYSNQKEHKGLCFDLYIQSESLPNFIASNQNLDFTVTPINGTYLNRVKPDNCSS